MKTLSQTLFVLILISNANVVYAQSLERGEAQYVKFCASCHGIAAKGDGPLAKSFNPPPTNLTQLAEKNGGRFPLVRVYDAIDGTAGVNAHDGTYMLLPTIVADPILRVIEYLMTLQGNSFVSVS
jgi:mono/diheme cytochrome c family protein